MRMLGFVCVAALATFLSVLQQPCNGGWIQNRDLRFRLKRQQERAWNNKKATTELGKVKTKRATLQSTVNGLSDYET